MSEIKKEIDLSGLPRRGKLIDWKTSIGYKCKFVYDDVEGEVEIVGYESIKKPIIIFKYRCEIYKMKSDSFSRCNFGKILMKITNDFRIEVGSKFKDDGRNLVITDREYRKDKNGRNWRFYKYTCNKCGWTEGWMEEHHLLSRNQGCSCCCPFPRTVVQGINDIPTTSPWMIPFFNGKIEEAKKYTKNSNKYIYPICPDCGRVKNKKTKIQDIYVNYSIGCSCSDGKPYDEKLFYHIVNEQLGLNMLWGANKNDYPWMGKYIYDFVDEERKIIWELDGGLGHGNKSYKESEKTVQETIEDDKRKSKLAKENGYEVKRIDTYYKKLDKRFEFVKKSLRNSEFSKIYNINNVNWCECNEFALTNFAKKICIYYENNPFMLQKEICKIFNLSRYTVMRYLKFGEQVGWCSNVRERSKRSIGESTREYNSKKVLCVELNEEFESITECAKQLTDRYDRKFTQTNISKVCTGERNHHQGFTFKYV